MTTDLPVPLEAIDALGAADLTYTDTTPEAEVRAVAAPVLAELFADEDALVDVITAAWVEDGYPDAEDMGPVALVAVQALARRFGAREDQDQ